MHFTSILVATASILSTSLALPLKPTTTTSSNTTEPTNTTVSAWYLSNCTPDGNRYSGWSQLFYYTDHTTSTTGALPDLRSERAHDYTYTFPYVPYASKIGNFTLPTQDEESWIRTHVNDKEAPHIVTSEGERWTCMQDTGRELFRELVGGDKDSSCQSFWYCML